ncbi:RNA polymerase II proximal promoter sequence-specific DNA binding [Balamuthia mandrillaris]
MRPPVSTPPTRHSPDMFYPKEHHIDKRNFILHWLQENYVFTPFASVEKASVFKSYLQMCKRIGIEGTTAPAFGRLVRTAFPAVGNCRRGPRGDARHHYKHLKRKEGAGNAQELLTATPDAPEYSPQTPGFTPMPMGSLPYPPPPHLGHPHHAAPAGPAPPSFGPSCYCCPPSYPSALVKTECEPPSSSPSAPSSSHHHHHSHHNHNHHNPRGPAWEGEALLEEFLHREESRNRVPPPTSLPHLPPSSFPPPYPHTHSPVQQGKPPQWCTDPSCSINKQTPAHPPFASFPAPSASASAPTPSPRLPFWPFPSFSNGTTNSFHNKNNAGGPSTPESDTTPAEEQQHQHQQRSKHQKFSQGGGKPEDFSSSSSSSHSSSCSSSSSSSTSASATHLAQPPQPPPSILSQ